MAVGGVGMSVRERLRMRKAVLAGRKAVLAGVVAVALTGTGMAIAWSATNPPSRSPSSVAPGNADNAPGPGKPDKDHRPQHLHGEAVVKKADGTFETRTSQRGTVEAVSGTSVTVRSEDGFTRTYAVTAETRIVKVPGPAADGSPAKGDDGKRLKPTDVTIAEITAGETVRVSGVKIGSEVTAKKIVEGAGDGPGLGHGKGAGKGHGRESGQAGKSPAK